MKIVKKIFKIITDILTFLVFLILILIIFAKFRMMFTGNDYFELFGYSIFSVATGSMEPAIKQNDIILIKKSKNYTVNDIVTFKGENAYITHRIISKRGNTIITKGDANNTKDATIEESQIIGKVVKVFNKAGVWQKVFTSPKTIILIFVTLILFDFAFSYKGNKKLEKEEVKEIEDEDNSKISDYIKIAKNKFNDLTSKVKNKTKKTREVKEIKEDYEDSFVKEKPKKDNEAIKKIKNTYDKTVDKLEDYKIRAKLKYNEFKTKNEKKKLLEKIKGIKFEQVLKRDDSPKMSKKEVTELYKKTEDLEEGRDVEFDTKEQDFLNYTIRLDLNELQKHIDDEINKE